MERKPVLVVMAAGMGSRYGGLKQIDPVGSCGEAILDYSVYDAHEAGFDTVVIIIKEAIRKDFMETVGARLAKSPVEIRYAYQELDKLPQGYAVPEGRVKPWGTCHAVLCGKDAIDGAPFAVINADDFYGKDAFAVMGKFLSDLPEGAKNTYSMVGFRVANTLSENGKVSRGVCEVNAEEKLVTVVERTEIVRRESGDVCYKDGEDWVMIPDNTPVSMNVWGFTPDYFEYSEEYFKEFLKENIEKPKSEYYIPLMVNELITNGTATVQVLDTTSKWFGVTYAADRPDVVAKIQELVNEGTYPSKLFS